MDCVIQLPSNLFFGTSIATCIMVMKKNKADNKTLFIDATSECVKVTNNNKLTPENIDRIVDMFAKREEVEYFAHLASYEEVSGNDYNLSVSTYVEAEDTREKIEVSLDEIETKIPELLETVQKDMFARAKAHRDAHIWDAHNYEEFTTIANEKPGFIRAMWCGDQACEDKIKEDLAVTSRCMPFNDQEQISDVCVCCGKPAHKLVYWGKAY